MRAPLVVGFAAAFSILLGPLTSSAQTSGPYPPAPYVQQGAYPPYPPYPPPSSAPPPGYVPPPGYAPYSPPPPRIKYQAGMTPPPGYHLEENPRKGLVVSGSVVFGTFYFLSATIGLSSSNTDDRWLLVPVLGPFVDIGARNEHGCTAGATASSATCQVFDSVIKFYLAFDGIAQTAGAVLLMTGFLLPKKEFVSDTYYGWKSGTPRVATWTVVPQVTPGSRYGLMLRGELF
jgi:hypothetical protein